MTQYGDMFVETTNESSSGFYTVREFQVTHTKVRMIVDSWFRPSKNTAFFESEYVIISKDVNIRTTMTSHHTVQ